jgi:hypothetical protein
MRKYLFFILLFVTLLMGHVPSVFAQTTHDRFTSDRKKAYSEIDKRIHKLKQLLSDVKKTKKLSKINQTNLINEISTVSAELTTMRLKIARETDSKSIKADRKQIIQKYNVYNVIVPQVKTLKTVDSMALTVDGLNVLTVKLQARIDLLTSGATDSATPANSTQSAAIRTIFEDLVSQTRIAQQQIRATAAIAEGLKPDGYPANKNTISSMKGQLKVIKKSLAQARNDAQKIIKILKTLPEPVVVQITVAPQDTPFPTIAPTEAILPTDAVVPTDEVIPTDAVVPTDSVYPTDEPIPTDPPLADPTAEPTIASGV